jgi:hypothetical protein
MHAKILLKKPGRGRSFLRDSSIEGNKAKKELQKSDEWRWRFLHLFEKF